ncbi:MAG TPA: hypothetical protein VF753_19915 [Terriglobales bacterium]
MNLKRSLAVLFVVAVACGIFLLPAQADNFNQKTKFEFSAPVELPGIVLPAGTYWFALQNDDETRQTVNIFAGDGTTLYATVYTATAQRSQAVPRTVIELAQQPNGSPDALLQWFYPGSLVGHTFLYPDKERQELRNEAKLTIRVNGDGIPEGGQPGL